MTVPRKRRVRLTLVTALSIATAAGLLSYAFGSAAQEAPVQVAGAPAPMLRPARPYWLELTPLQRQALGPLADDWERLDFQTKKKWVEISNRYPRMAPEEQTRTRDRMREWVSLTPEQRRVARDSYARIQSMPPAQRAEMLRKYQELPLQQRQALATEGRVAKPLIVPKPMTIPTPRRNQIREGARVRNPAMAAEKSASPVTATHPKAAVAAPKPAPAAALPVPASTSAAGTDPKLPAAAAPLPATPSVNGSGPAVPAAPPAIVPAAASATAPVSPATAGDAVARPGSKP